MLFGAATLATSIWMIFHVWWLWNDVGKFAQDVQSGRIPVERAMGHLTSATRVTGPSG